MDYVKLAEQASFLEERRDHSQFICSESERSTERLESWRKLLNVVPNQDLFAMRLLHDNLTEQEARLLCGDVTWKKSAPLPTWSVTLDKALSRLPAEEAELWNRVALIKEEIKLVGPITALLPFVEEAESQLREHFGETLPMKSVSEILLHRLYYLCSQTFNARARRMALLGQVKAEQANELWDVMSRELIGGRWEEMLVEFPVLARRIGTMVEYFVAFLSEAFERIEAHKSEIEAQFFAGNSIECLVSVEGEISDLHQQGKSVLILTFHNNQKLVYKPRSLEIDAAWEVFLLQFAAGGTSIKAPHALDFGHYGFIEYIEHAPCESEAEIEEYYHNAGALMAILHSFAGNDFHMENLIANGKVPVLIDTETLMIPVARPFAYGGKDQPKAKQEEAMTLEETIENSVIKTGLMPFWQKDGENRRVDYGGLTGDKEGMKNLPVFAGVKYPGNAYGEQISQGFNQMYDQILLRREELLSGKYGLSLFSKCKFRMLIRSTQVYGNVLQHITHPSFLTDGFTFSQKPERLVNAFLYEADESIIPDLLRVFKSERDAILRGDLPIFYCEPSGEGILDETGMLFEHYFGTSAIANAEKRIRSLCEADKRIQMQIIEKSMAAEVRNVHEYYEAEEHEQEHHDDTANPQGREDLLQEAIEIYREIMDNRFVSQSGDYSWLAEQYDMQRGGTALNVMGPSIYDGLLGIALFMGALSVVADFPEAAKEAEKCAQKAWAYLELMIPNMDRYQMQIGYSSGIAGYISGFALLSRYLKSEELYGKALQLVKAVTPAMMKRDVYFDVLGGVSGMVLTLTDEARFLDDEETSAHVKMLLTACGEHLLENKKKAVDEHLLWEIKECSKPLTGLGHGVAGIAAALYRLYEVFGEERYLQAGHDAIRYENVTFDEAAGNWPDYRRDPHQKNPGEQKFMAGYCAGAPGIGLARLDSWKRLQGKAREAIDWSLDVKRAEEFIIKMPTEGRNHLCCGSAGRIDFLIEKSNVTNDENALMLAQAKLSALIASKKRRGHYNFHVTNGRYYYNPTLFQGTAGIGYEILRLLEPQKVRTILM